MSVRESIASIKNELPANVTLVAVSKTQSNNAIIEAYEAGQIIFGESRPQEMAVKHSALPHDIKWHMIGHLQTNKVKLIAPFVDMIQSVDSERLLNAINSQALKNNRSIDVLLEMHIAQEESKSGWQYEHMVSLIENGNWNSLNGVIFRGVMGIATHTLDTSQVEHEFETLQRYFNHLRPFFDSGFDTISMGMSSDWPLAVECGSNMVRVGSAIFGDR